MSARRCLEQFILAWIAGFFLSGSAAFAGLSVEVHDPRTGARLGRAHPSIVIVQFDPAATAPERAAVHAAIGASEFQNLGRAGLFAVHLPPNVSPDEALKYYAAQGKVGSVSPDFLYHVSKAANDPLAPQQYGLSQIDAFAGWEFETGYSSPVTVAVMDTGVAVSHPEFLPLASVSPGNFKYDDVHSRDFCSLSAAANPGDTCAGGYGTDVVGHGTEVAGIAAADSNNGAGIAGVSWGAKIVSLKIFTDQGDGDDSAIIAALNYAVALATATGRRTVVNMSLGECPDCANPSTCGACSGALTSAVGGARASGVVLVAAAGNLDTKSSPGCPGGGNPYKNVTCPAKIPGVISVGATDASQSITYYSCQGVEMSTQGVAAPGDFIETTSANGSYTSGARGTSFASPHAAGLAALVLSAKPSFTPDQVLATLRSSAESIGYPSTAQGAGRINAYLALRLAVGGTLAAFDGLQKVVAFPNPFRPSENGAATITVPASLAGSSQSIKIYAMDGRLVRVLTGQSWDGKNDQGVPVATGTYLFLVSTSVGKATGKLALIR